MEIWIEEECAMCMFKSMTAYPWEKKVHTYDIIGHMVWQPCWIYPKTYKKTRTAGQIEGKLHTSVPQAMGLQVAHSKHSSWGMSVVFL